MWHFRAILFTTKPCLFKFVNVSLTNGLKAEFPEYTYLLPLDQNSHYCPLLDFPFALIFPLSWWARANDIHTQPHHISAPPESSATSPFIFMRLLPRAVLQQTIVLSRKSTLSKMKVKQEYSEHMFRDGLWPSLSVTHLRWLIVLCFHTTGSTVAVPAPAPARTPEWCTC